MTESVVVIGNFDGVHTGHQQVLAEAVRDADHPLIVVTFWPHPVTVLRPDKAPKLLSDLRSRIELLKHAGAHEVRVIQFNEEVANLSPAEFVDRFLAPLHPVRIVVGANFRFGHRAAGDVETLAKLGAGRFEVRPLPLSSIDDEVSCSTSIRSHLAEGDVAAAAQHLGRPFRFRGVVVVGDQRGRELGFPTANLTVPHDMAVPADGVYAGWVTVLDEPGAEPMPAAISVGTNPTFDGSDHRVESYVLDRTDLELYGSEIAVDFVARLRGQVRFEGIDALVQQMGADVEATRRALAQLPQ
ncbi:bifunctional riboflavin kinase/FAD synthetase [Tessaracoccus sp. MC1865]|uniref:bifunctional riboflavin kinase/FAD synthetase n=1 Tax=Tessaracoccus sp. MC1865 TaxID=2760310 RepID=UPI0016008D22|nr:bifunctional riboflavin kinase/FAD synthetase [Tessaracoccus sp. MC1865]MBB1484844.1 bifunctional riboflavin kinase/FAD synthetase [Tessaracoccus sp. MC1865]QTO38754.1 bifunctional riboflavin kinase/FAD synthetase [Tessaracoccus sp. MC1865]